MSELFCARPEPSRSVLTLAGADRAKFLQGLISNDVRKLSPAQGLWAGLLTPQGKYLYDFLLVETGEAILIDAEAGVAADLAKRLGLYKLRADITLADATAEMEVSVAWGADSLAAFDLSAPGQTRRIGDAIILADPRLAALGLRILAPRGAAAALLDIRGFAAAPWTDWDRLRLRLGVPDGRRDMVPDKAILLENGFDELGGVAWDKGCYIGQELTARTKYRGLIKKRLMPIRFDGPAPPPGTLITRDGAEAGEIRSGQTGLALALIRLEALTDGGPLLAGDVSVRVAKPDWAGF